MENSMLTISTIVISSCSKYELKRAIESINNQTRKADEIIIVDLNKDNYSYVQDMIDNIVSFVCPDAALEDQRKLNNYELIQIGLKYVNSEYVSFLDSKDIWYNNVLEKYDEVINTTEQMDIVISNYSRKAGFVLDYNVCDCVKDKLAEVAFVQFLDSPTSILLKYDVAVCLDTLDIKSLVVGQINKKLSEQYSITYGEGRELENAFWNTYYEFFKQHNLLNAAMVYCLKVYHNSAVDRDAFIDFAENVSLSVRDGAELIYGEPQIERIAKTERDVLNSDIHKKHSYYELMRDWVELKNAGGSVESNLLEREFRKIAIYGAGKHGTMLYDELKDSNITIEAWIDGNPKVEYLKNIKVIPLAYLDKVILDVDVIIVTPIVEYDTIVKNLKEKTPIKVISLGEIVKA